MEKSAVMDGELMVIAWSGAGMSVVN